MAWVIKKGRAPAYNTLQPAARSKCVHAELRLGYLLTRTDRLVPNSQMCHAMKIALYAPMKPPDGLRPSGDRAIARLLARALQAAGFDVRLASSLRTWSARASAHQLAAFKHAGRVEAEALLAAYGGGPQVLRGSGAPSDGEAYSILSTCPPPLGWRPDLWLTYHNYYKAPDLLGPQVAEALGIPYAIVEASYSARRGHDEWADWLAAARAGFERADALFSFTERDRAGLADICSPDRLHKISPFIDLDTFPEAVPAPSLPRSVAAPRRIKLVTVAMMRTGAKQQSYQLLIDALGLIPEANWQLDIAGDGAARGEIEEAICAFPAGSVPIEERFCLHGLLDAPAVRELMSGGDVFVWPGVDEAFGMAYLEAQACGLPVVAVRTAGVPEVVRHGESGLLADVATAEALASALLRIITDSDLRLALRAGALTAVRRDHSLAAASVLLGTVLGRLVARQ